MNASKSKRTLNGISLSLTSSLCFVLLLSIITWATCVSSAKSQIVFQNGVYENITIALDEDDASAETGCRDIISKLLETFTQASLYLQQATDGKAAFGSVRVLIPARWNYSSCSSTTIEPSFFESYESADIKVSGTHPIAVSLPWTDQPGLCGKPGNNIYVPSNFLWNTNFSTEARAAMLLHEWMKFRYGVFEEYGFFGDPYFPACYSKGSATYFTACMSPTPPPLETASQSARTCKQLIEENQSRLKTQVAEAASRSIMFAPQITPTQNLVCKEQSHNRLAITKQKYLCDRRSIETIMLQHPDFKKPLGMRKTGQIKSVSIQPAKLSKTIPAYAIVVDDSKALTQMQIDVLLRSLYEFIYFVRMDTMLYFMPIDQDLEQFRPYNITTPAHKEEFYEMISTTLQVRPRDNGNPKVDSDVYQIVQNKLKEKGPERKWHVLHIATPPPNPERVLPALKTCDFKLKLVTFDSSSGDWLQWNSVAQTDFVLVLPTCTASDRVCIDKTSLVLTTKLLEDLENEDPTRHFQLVLEGRNNFNGHMISVSDLKVPVKGFLMTMFNPEKHNTLNVTSPGRKCSVRSLTNNSKSHLFTTDCFYEPGNWTVADSHNETKLEVRAFVELDGNGVRAIPQVGLNLDEKVYPNRHRMSIPLHIAVRSKQDQPILTASVEAEISFLRSGSGLETRTFQLKDDGVYPDSTKDDGVYSGYFVGWSEQPSYHFGLARITTNVNTRTLTEISTETTSAALLDTNMDSKCCGSSVPLKSTIPAPSSTTLLVPLPSMLTGETLNSPSLRPPGEITFLEKTSESDVSVELTVVSPETGNEDSAIAYYLACSTECSDGCAIIDPEQCKPRDAGENGPCTVNKAKLRESAALWSCPAASSGSLQLALAGVNSADERGRLSRQVFDVTLTRESSSDELTCKSLKDKCLPIWLFWTLIGVLGGLLIVVVIVLICVCCFCRRNSKKNASEGKAAFISQPYSAEKLTNGGFKPTPTPTKEPEKKYDYSPNGNNEDVSSSAYFTQRPADIRRPPGEENFGYTSFSASTAKQVNPYTGEKRENNQEPQYTHYSMSRQDFSAPNYSSANSKSLPRKYSAHDQDISIALKSAKSQKDITSPAQPPGNQYGQKIRTVSSFVDDDPSDINSREPAYATVSRKHRRNNQNPTYRYSQPPLMAQQTARPIQFVKSKDNTRPRSTIGGNFGYSHATVDRFSARPVRLDHFPSSESETYSEMSRLESLPPGPPPPPPPPMPSASNSTKFHANRQVPKRETVVPNDDDTQSDSSVPPEVSNRAVTPSVQPNGFGILAQMGSVPDRKSLLKPQQGPPPPPPRSSGRKFDPSFLHAANIHDVEDSPGRGRKTSRISDVDENDSDTWDIDDDFQYDPDVSHV